MVDIGRDAVDVGGASRVKFLDRRAFARARLSKIGPTDECSAALF
jgi:hypothetical protein